MKTTPTCRIDTMCSENYKALDPIAKARYANKLKYLNLKFVNNMRKWPAIEFGHIFCYYIDGSGLYTRKQLLQWKSLDGYNYFQSGHVRDILIWEIDSTCSILKAKVNPSQSPPEKAHICWVAAKITGDIIFCHCTCMAGLGEGCSHSAAILFKIESAVKNGYTASTSTVCQWNQGFSKKHEPSMICNIDFSKPSASRVTEENDQSTRKKKRKIKEPTEEEKRNFITTLSDIYPDSAVLMAFMPVRQPLASNYTAAICSLPRTITYFHHPKYQQYSHAQLMSDCDTILKNVLR
uniref:SWIM-type domain-containing protein n=2 Tax=Amphimedon queenslandica TaxID=400682 RepID=A0A1X7U845_AMPQE